MYFLKMPGPEKNYTNQLSSALGHIKGNQVS